MTGGLVVSPSNLSSSCDFAQWGCMGTGMGANSHSIGGGASNTANILANCSETDIAATIASDYDGGGYTDWYLPSTGEVDEMFDLVGQGSFSSFNFVNS